MTPQEYLDEQTRLLTALWHALEQCDKDQHLNVAMTLADAQRHALGCLDFFLKGGDIQAVRRLREEDRS